MEITKSSAIRPVVETAFPKANWHYADFFGDLTQKSGSGTVDESKWRDFSIHVSPQKRFEAAFQKGFLGIKPNTLVSAARAHSSSSVYVTVDTRVLYRIKALVYPGNEAIEVQGKWIYAFHLNALTALAEVFAESPNLWLFRYNPTFPANTPLPPPDKFCDGKLELPMIKADESPSSVGFFISPFRLTSEAVKFLLEDDKRLKSACVRPVRESAQSLFAAVPDPYQWAVDAHEKYYIPLLDEWQNYIFNPERQARLFIASTLKAWITAKDEGIIYDSTDPLDIEDELKSGEPDRFLNQYKSEEEQLSVKTEKAAAYLYHCAYAPEHRATEKAALEAKDSSSLTLTFQNWAIISERATETAQGRMFAINAFNDQTRLPKRYLFQEDAPQSLPDTLKNYFPNTRYAWAAAIALAGDLLPAVIKDIQKITDHNVAKQINANIIKYLENLGIEKPGMVVPKNMPGHIKGKAGKTLYHQLKQNKGLTEGVTHKTTIERVEKLYEKILKETDVATVPKAIGEKSLDTPVHKLHKFYDESFISRNRLKIAIVFETINVIFGILEFNESNGKAEWNNDKFVSLIGASADFAAVIAEPTFKAVGLEEIAFQKIGLKKAGGLAVGKALGGVAGIIGGICQMSDEQRQMVEGYAQYDYGVAAGHGIAAAGAAMTAVGGGLILAEAVGVGTAAGGPVGTAIGAIGAGLIIGGNLLAGWLKDKQQEQFARFCSFGKQYDTVSNQIYELSEKLGDYNPINIMYDKPKFQRTPVYPDWSGEGALPTDNILKEARLLMWLLCGFQLELEKKTQQKSSEGNHFLVDSFIKINPGYLPPSAKIEIKIEQTYSAWHSPTSSPNTPEETFETTLVVDQILDEISYLHGDIIPLKTSDQIKRDEFQNIEYIKFPVRPDKVKFDNKTMSFDEYLHYGGNYGYINSLQRYFKSGVVKVRISMGNVWQPSAAQYLQLEFPYADEKVSSSDSSKWIS